MGTHLFRVRAERKLLAILVGNVQENDDAGAQGRQVAAKVRGPVPGPDHMGLTGPFRLGIPCDSVVL